MSETEPVILTNMCMVCDGTRVLVQDRVDPEWPGIVFPGGHVKPGEPFACSVVREVEEETGLTVSDLRLCGVKQWTHPKGLHRYVVLLYRADRFAGTLRDSDEGRVLWVEREALESCRLAEGFFEMLPVFEREDLTEMFFRYENGKWVYDLL